MQDVCHTGFTDRQLFSSSMAFQFLVWCLVNIFSNRNHSHDVSSLAQIFDKLLGFFRYRFVSINNQDDRFGHIELFSFGEFFFFVFFKGIFKSWLRSKVFN